MLLFSTFHPCPSSGRVVRGFREVHMARTPYRGKAWANARAEVLDRDGHLCQIQLPGCRRVADSVDHIVDIQFGGDWYEPTNLRAACTPCNSAKSNRTRRPTPPTTPYLDW